MAVIAFLVAVVSFGDAPERQCLGKATPDPAYRVESAGPVYTDDGSGYRFTMLREGRPLEGVSACLRAGLGGSEGLPELAVADTAQEISPGLYWAPVTFDLRGEWTGRVVVGGSGDSAVEIPVTIEVVGPAPE